MVLIFLHVAHVDAACAGPLPNGPGPDLCGNHLVLKACQQPLRLGQDQIQIGNIGEIIGPADLHNIRGLCLALSPDVHELHNPGHASNVRQKTNAGYNPLALTP